MNQFLNVIAIMKSVAGKEDELKQILQTALPKFQQEPGCVSYSLMEDKDDSTHFLTFETWENEEALQAHFKGPTMTEITPTLQALLVSPLELHKGHVFSGSTAQI